MDRRAAVVALLIVVLGFALVRATDPRASLAREEAALGAVHRLEARYGLRVPRLPAGELVEPGAVPRVVVRGDRIGVDNRAWVAAQVPAALWQTSEMLEYQGDHEGAVVLERPDAQLLDEGEPLFDVAGLDASWPERELLTGLWLALVEVRRRIDGDPRAPHPAAPRDWSTWTSGASRDVAVQVVADAALPMALMGRVIYSVEQAGFGGIRGVVGRDGVTAAVSFTVQRRCSTTAVHDLDCGVRMIEVHPDAVVARTYPLAGSVACPAGRVELGTTGAWVLDPPDRRGPESCLALAPEKLAAWAAETPGCDPVVVAPAPDASWGGTLEVLAAVGPGAGLDVLALSRGARPPDCP